MERCKILIISGLVFFALVSCEQRFGKHDIPMDSSLENWPAAIAYLQETEPMTLEVYLSFLNVKKELGWSGLQVESFEFYNAKFKYDKKVCHYASEYYLSSEKLDSALKYNFRAEQLGANSADLYLLRSKIYSARKEYGLAIDYINKAVTMNSDDPDIYRSKGDIYLNFGDSISSLRYNTIAFEQDSTRLDIGHDLARLFVSTGDFQRGEALISYLQSHNYESNDLLYLMVDILGAKEKQEEANSLLYKLFSKGDLLAGEMLRFYFLSIKSYDSLIVISSRILELDSLNIDALNGKALAFDHQGYYSSALQYFNQTLLIDSLNEEAMQGVRKVNGKIAYLRKLQKQRESIPTFDFASPEKKKTIN